MMMVKEQSTFKNNMTPSKYYTQINGIRTIFFLLIVLYHYCFHHWGLEATDYIPNICIIWGGFFFISGSLLKEYDGKVWWKKKLDNIIIPYWIAVGFIYLIENMFNRTSHVSIKALGLNYLIVPLLCGAQYVDGAHWFVVNLIYYYFLFWFASKIKKASNRSDDVFEYVIILYSVLSTSFLFLKENSFILNIIHIVFNPRLSFISLGYIYRRNIERSRRAFTVKGIIMLGTVAVYIAITTHWINILYFLFVLYVICLCFKDKVGFLEIGLFQVLGSSSYYIYLIHQRIGYLIIDNSISRFFGTMAALTYCIIGGMIFQRLLYYLRKRFV